MLPLISENAHCSKRYTNHSIRVGCVSTLENAGFSSDDIASVSGHKDGKSVQKYVRQNVIKKREMSDCLQNALIPNKLTREVQNAEVVIQQTTNSNKENVYNFYNCNVTFTK